METLEEEEIRIMLILGVLVIALFLALLCSASSSFFSLVLFLLGVLRTLTPLTIEMAANSAYFINIIVWAIFACRTLRRKL